MEEKKGNSENLATEKDWLLQTVIQLVNNNEGLTFGLTIITHGQIVSGNIIGGKKYFENLGKEIELGLGTDNDENPISEQFKKIGDDVYSEEKQKIDGSPAYIHFGDAKFYFANGEPIPGNKGLLWRGRLSEISGFNIGKLEL